MTGQGFAVRGAVAAAVYNSVSRDLRARLNAGGGVPAWAVPVLQGLAVAAEFVPEPELMSVMGRGVATMDVSPMVTVKVAALQVHRTERHVRRLCSSGAVIARRAGERTWLVDLASLQNVIGRSNVEG